MILDSDGSEIDWHVGYGPPPEKFLERLEKTVNGVNTFKSLSEAYAKEPNNVKTITELAKKYDSRYKQDKSLELYKKVITLDPEGRMGTTDYMDEKVPCTEYAEFSIGRLGIYSMGGKRDPGQMKAFIEKYPESKLLKNAYSYTGMYYRSGGTKEEAREFFEEYTAKYPDDPGALSAYVSRIIRDKDNLDRGIELGEKIKDLLKYNPNPRYMKDLAQLYILKGDVKKADDIYGKSFMEGQVSSLAYNLLDYANLWSKEEKNQESVEEMMDISVMLKPDSTYVLQSAARVFLKLDKLDKAKKIFGPDFAAENQDDASALSMYARFWSNEGENLKDALKAAEKAVEMAPAYYNWDILASVHLKLKNYDKAIKAEEKAIELAGDRADRYKSKLEQIKKAKEKEKK
ncbi:MAG: tetratricopeptide repeat protein [Candidatus Aminicenantes bacterium]